PDCFRWTCEPRGDGDVLERQGRSTPLSGCRMVVQTVAVDRGAMGAGRRLAAPHCGQNWPAHRSILLGYENSLDDGRGAGGPGGYRARRGAMQHAGQLADLDNDWRRCLCDGSVHCGPNAAVQYSQLRVG